MTTAIFPRFEQAYQYAQQAERTHLRRTKIVPVVNALREAVGYRVVWAK